jgi:hypothetical protein
MGVKILEPALSNRRIANLTKAEPTGKEKPLGLV